MTVLRDSEGRHVRHTERLAHRVAGYVNENLAINLQLTYVARQFHVSKSTLSHTIKIRFGIPYGRFVEIQRMQKALKSIESDGLLVKEAMHKTGYKTRASFIRAFKRHYGQNPSFFK